MAKVVNVGDKVWNRTLGCEATVLSQVRDDGTIYIETPYGKIYCFLCDLEAR